MKPGQEVAFVSKGWLSFGSLKCIKTTETVTGTSVTHTIVRDGIDYEVSEDECSEIYGYRIEQLYSHIRLKEVLEEPLVPTAVEQPSDDSL